MPHLASGHVGWRRLFDSICGNSQHSLGATQWQQLEYTGQIGPTTGNEVWLFIPEIFWSSLLGLTFLRRPRQPRTSLPVSVLLWIACMGRHFPIQAYCKTRGKWSCSDEIGRLAMTLGWAGGRLKADFDADKDQHLLRVACVESVWGN